MSVVKGIEAVEAVLFASGKAMEEDHIKELTGLKPKETKHALEALQQSYHDRDTALFIWNEGTKWKINVKEEYVEIVKTLAAETELARAVLETLAVIAYRSPVLQSDVITARGSGAYDHISELVEKGFITKEKFARSYKLKISDKFYHYFDVADGDIREALAAAKQPDVEKIAAKVGGQKKLGELDVVDALSDEATMEAHRKETQVEIYNIEQQREDDKKNYLNDFESRLQETSARIGEAEKDILEQKEQLAEEQAGQEVREDDEEQGEQETTQHDETAKNPDEEDKDPQALVKEIEDEIDEITKKD